MPKRFFAQLLPSDWNDRKLHRYFCMLVPLLCGLYSLWLGQDSNGDLLNYHRYNPFALLNGKLELDLAPAGMRTYFNPTLDLPYYWMTRYWPAPLAGFIMGVIDGLIFPLLLGIARAVCPRLPEEDQNRVPLLLALAGSLTIGVLSTIGSSRGDITSALPVLAGLCLVTQRWDRLHDGMRATMGSMLLAGILVGAGAGLKLTNMIYALSMCSALAMLSTSWRNRLKVMTWFGIAILIGLAISAGYWFWLMWAKFGNPLFPQFGSFFPDPLAPTGLIYDMQKQPQSALQTLLWPILMTLDPAHVSEIRMGQINWALIYLLFIARGVLTISKRINGRIQNRVTRNSPGDYVLAHMAIGFILWIPSSCIYRYLFTIEVLTPLAIWLLINRMLPYIQARRASLFAIVVSTEYSIFSKLFQVLTAPLVAKEKLWFFSSGWQAAMLIILLVAGFLATRLLPDVQKRRVVHFAIIFSAVVVFVGGIDNWGHVGWENKAFTVSVPPLSDPTHTMVLLTNEAEARAWIIPDFPATVAVAVLKSSLPKTELYVRMVHAMMDNRRGPTYAILEAPSQTLEYNIAARNRSLSKMGLLRNASICKFIARYSAPLKLNWVQSAAGGQRCEFSSAEPWSPPSTLELVMQNNQIAKEFGLRLDPTTCKTFAAHLGDKPFPYQWCRVLPLEAQN